MRSLITAEEAATASAGLANRVLTADLKLKL